jgi:hypothetical protein
LSAYECFHKLLGNDIEGGGRIDIEFCEPGIDQVSEIIKFYEVIKSIGGDERK